MSKILRSLIWKEWHEQRWKIAFSGLLLMGFTGIGLYTRIIQDEVIVVIGGLVAMILLPILVSMDLVAGERANGSLPALFALPSHPSTILGVKMLMGGFVCVVPLASNLILFWLIAGSREIESDLLLKSYIGMMGCSISGFIWMLCLGMRQPSEARVALLSMGLVAAWVAIISTEEILFHSLNKESPISLLVTPIGLFFAFSQGHAVQKLLAAGTQLILFLIFLYWAERRFEKLARTQS